ncbi:protein-tyrosine phosphatase family protein [Urbifossiella limnaea]|uniref:Swiss Army Knife protein DSP-PTPase phosphatase domain-containing protein n=1 Tax=Urbifossiella limnaea TaxID=2528023 RepID=A0A517Y0Y0_9BACT|nr:hypothetical protein [Urbifossiella limnaea]QDU23419.1 hypothetical protein ETAA1_54190 [Urbifossiella limnaea]
MIYRITEALSVGRFPPADWTAPLLARGVTHVVNVSGRPSEVAAGDGAFREVAWFPLDDSRRIPTSTALHVLDELHRMATQPGAHVYVHCGGGCYRGPTALWLYLVACGADPDAVREEVVARAPDASPGPPSMVGPDLILEVQRHGRTHFLPHPRPEVLALVPVPT